jgi:ABC-type Mn2+/Zn2+ transport system permease subunit
MSTENLALAIMMSVAAGLVGCFAVMRRMALAADALSHVALPGIGIALALHISPIFGAAAMLFFGSLLVWAVEGKARIGTEAVVGVLFSLALAAGSMTTFGEDLMEALFGGAGKMTPAELAFGLIASAAIIAFIVTQRSRLVVMLVSPDVARTAGIPVRRLELLFLETFALTIALGLRYLGVLLMGALIIIPAAAAKRVAHNLASMLIAAVAIAVASTVIGTWLASSLHRETGPLIVIAAAGFFALSFLRR